MTAGVRLDNLAAQIVSDIIPPADTVFCGVSRVESGTTVRLIPGDPTPQVSEFSGNNDVANTPSNASLSSMIRRSLAKHVDASGALAICLSGGLDSTVLLYEAVSLGIRVKAYCYLLPKSRMADRQLRVLRAITETTGVDIEVIDLTEAVEECFADRLRTSVIGGPQTASIPLVTQLVSERASKEGYDSVAFGMFADQLWDSDRPRYGWRLASLDSTARRRAVVQFVDRELSGADADTESVQTSDMATVGLTDLTTSWTKVCQQSQVLRQPYADAALEQIKSAASRYLERSARVVVGLPPSHSRQWSLIQLDININSPGIGPLIESAFGARKANCSLPYLDSQILAHCRNAPVESRIATVLGTTVDKVELRRAYLGKLPEHVVGRREWAQGEAIQQRMVQVNAELILNAIQSSPVSEVLDVDRLRRSAVDSRDWCRLARPLLNIYQFAVWLDGQWD